MIQNKPTASRGGKRNLVTVSLQFEIRLKNVKEKHAEDTPEFKLGVWAKMLVIMYRSIRNFNIPSPGRRREFDFLAFQIPRHLDKKCVQMPHRHTENYEKLQYKRQEISSHHARHIIMNQVHESGRLYMSRKTI